MRKIRIRIYGVQHGEIQMEVEVPVTVSNSEVGLLVRNLFDCYWTIKDWDWV